MATMQTICLISHSPPKTTLFHPASSLRASRSATPPAHHRLAGLRQLRARLLTNAHRIAQPEPRGLVTADHLKLIGGPTSSNKGALSPLPWAKIVTGSTDTFEIAATFVAEPLSPLRIPDDSLLLLAFIERAAFFTTLQRPPTDLDVTNVRIWRLSKSSLSALQVRGCRMVYLAPDGCKAKVILKVTTPPPLRHWLQCSELVQLHTWSGAGRHNLRAFFTLPLPLSRNVWTEEANRDCVALAIRVVDPEQGPFAYPVHAAPGQTSERTLESDLVRGLNYLLDNNDPDIERDIGAIQSGLSSKLRPVPATPEHRQRNRYILFCANGTRLAQLLTDLGAPKVEKQGMSMHDLSENLPRGRVSKARIEIALLPRATQQKPDYDHAWPVSASAPGKGGKKLPVQNPQLRLARRVMKATVPAQHRPGTAVAVPHEATVDVTGMISFTDGTLQAEDDTNFIAHIWCARQCTACLPIVPAKPALHVRAGSHHLWPHSAARLKRSFCAKPPFLQQQFGSECVMRAFNNAMQAPVFDHFLLGSMQMLLRVQCRNAAPCGGMLSTAELSACVNHLHPTLHLLAGPPHWGAKSGTDWSHTLCSQPAHCHNLQMALLLLHADHAPHMVAAVSLDVGGPSKKWCILDSAHADDLYLLDDITVAHSFDAHVFCLVSTEAPGGLQAASPATARQLLTEGARRQRAVLAATARADRVVVAGMPAPVFDGFQRQARHLLLYASLGVLRHRDTFLDICQKSGLLFLREAKFRNRGEHLLLTVHDQHHLHFLERHFDAVKRCVASRTGWHMVDSASGHLPQPIPDQLPRASVNAFDILMRRQPVESKLRACRVASDASVTGVCTLNINGLNTSCATDKLLAILSLMHARGVGMMALQETMLSQPGAFGDLLSSCDAGDYAHFGETACLTDAGHPTGGTSFIVHRRLLPHVRYRGTLGPAGRFRTSWLTAMGTTPSDALHIGNVYLPDASLYNDKRTRHLWADALAAYDADLDVLSSRPGSHLLVGNNNNTCTSNHPVGHWPRRGITPRVYCRRH